MQTLHILKSIKIYSSVARCCRYTGFKPGFVQPVFDKESKKLVGFAALPEKISGQYIYWVK